MVYWGSSCENGMDKPVPYWIWFCALPFAVLHFVQEVRIFRYTAARMDLGVRVGWAVSGLRVEGTACRGCMVKFPCGSSTNHT